MTWSTVPFWSIARRVERTGQPDAELLSVYREWGVIRKSDRDDNFNRASDDLSTYKVVRQGDLVLNKMKTWQGSLGVSPFDGIVSPAYFVCELSPTVDGRFIHHLLRSHRMVAEFLANSKGIRPNQWDLPYEVLRQLPIPMPTMSEQRRIADFLDDRVARVDRIIAARYRQVEMIADAAEAEADRCVSQDDWECSTRFGYSISSIEQGWSPQCDSVPAGPGDWGVLKVGAVRAGAFRANENKLLPANVVPVMRYEVKPGDLLVTRANTPNLVGAFATVPNDVRPRLIFSDKIMRVSLASSLLPEFASLVGQTRRVRDILTSAGTGTSQSMVNVRGDDVRSLPMPRLSLREQRARVNDWLRGVTAMQEGLSMIEVQVALLQEYKQSLITAAVTGEFDVTTASTKIPEN